MTRGRIRDVETLLDRAYPAEVDRAPARADSERYFSYRGRELEFMRDVLGLRTRTGQVALWAAQRAISDEFFRPGGGRVHVRACRKGGKSFGLGALALTSIFTRPCTVLCMSAGWQTVTDVSFAAIRQIFHGAPTQLPGEMLKTRLELGPRHKLIGAAFANPDKAQGHHAGVIVPDDPDDLTMTREDVLQAIAESDDAHELVLILDEAASIDLRIFEALEGSMAGSNVRVLLSGNPTIAAASSHPFARIGQPGSNYHRIKISAVPESEAPDPVPADEVFAPVPPWLLDPRWIDDTRKTYGGDSAWFKAYVLGQYADAESTSAVISLEQLIACADLEPENDWGAHIGVDLGVTNDQSVAVLAIDGRIEDMHAWVNPTGAANSATLRNVEEVQRLQREWSAKYQVEIPWSQVHLDSSGYGQGPTDNLRDAGCYVDGVQFAGSPRNMWRHEVGAYSVVNMRAELWWAVRLLLQKRMVSIPARFDRIWADLQSTEWGIAEVGGEAAVQLEKKAACKKRLGRSPDAGDACCLALMKRRGVGVAFSFGAAGTDDPEDFLRAPAWDSFARAEPWG